MRLYQPFKKDYAIGLDIGSSSVKAAQFEKDQDTPRLIKASIEAVTHKAGEAPGDNEVISALKAVLRGADVRRSEVTAVINCPHTQIKRVVAPYMPRDELKEGLKLEAKNYFNFSIENSLVDFEVLGDIVENGVRKYEVLVAVSPAETVTRYLSLFKKVGIVPAALIPSAYALMKMAHRLYPEPGNAACLVDVGEVDTELVICKGKDIAFSRKIPVTGKDFTRSMTEALISDLGRTELSAGEAEDIKRKVGIPAEGELKTIDGKITTAQVLSMLRTPAEQLAAEISRSFDYIREEVSGVSVDKLVLFGGGASLGGLLKFISTELGMNAVLGDSLEGLALEPHAVIDRGKVSYSLELAVGAALAGSGGLNLLPAEVRKMAGRTFRRASYEAVAAAAIFISAFLYIGMRMKLDNFNTRIEFAKKELVGLDSQLKYSEAKALADKVLLDEPFWEEVLRELSNSVPSDIHLTELAMAKNTLTVKGVASSRDNDAVISDFITAMEKGLFDNVRIVSTKDVEGGDTTEFELAFWVDMG